MWKERAWRRGAAVDRCCRATLSHPHPFMVRGGGRLRTELEAAEEARASESAHFTQFSRIPSSWTRITQAIEGHTECTVHHAMWNLMVPLLSLLPRVLFGLLIRSVRFRSLSRSLRRSRAPNLPPFLLAPPSSSSLASSSMLFTVLRALDDCCSCRWLRRTAAALRCRWLTAC